MAKRQLKRLSAIQARNLRTPGYHADGGGLYLQVSPSGSKSWVFCYTLAGREREMGLGAEHTFTLAQARERAAAQRALLADGIDPIEHRRAARRADRGAREGTDIRRVCRRLHQGAPRELAER